MSSSKKTPYYNLSQFQDADKPSWRGDYNGDMDKIDTGIRDAKDTAIDARRTANDMDAKIEEVKNTYVSKVSADEKYATKTLVSDTKNEIETNANNTFVTKSVYNENIATNASEFEQYKTTTDTHLSTLDTTVAAKANSSDVYTKSYMDEHFANRLVGQAAAYKTGTERDFTMTSPTDYKEVQFDAPAVLSPAWAELGTNQADIALTPGVYQVNFELRLINIAAGGEAYKTSIRCEISDMAGSSPTVLGQVDTYFVKESTNDAVLSGAIQGAALSIVESVGKLQHIRLRLHAPHMSAEHHITGRVDHAAISFVKLADATTTRAFARLARATEENWSSGN